MGIQQGSPESEDRLIWHFAKNGEYNVRSGYITALNGRVFEENSNTESIKKWWKHMWSLRVPPKVKQFLWKLSGANFDLFVMISWQLWYSRNLSLHNNFSPKSEDVIAVATRILEEYQSNHGRRSPKANTPAPERKRWAPPVRGSLLFNVDAAIDTTNKSSSARGVLRDHNGNCVISFQKYWHFPFNPYVAELKAIKESILIAGNRNLRGFYIQSDCLNGVKAINSSYVLDRDVEFLLEDIKKRPLNSHVDFGGLLLLWCNCALVDK
ncbi:hypothetical protein G4B88_030378 [Cannabis sativa]|uniref:RNase H type-1 domain-containing protein n=1 Tax=Cannabis sativa TaxID=3483 RepID=A0A7J6E0E1_CANSA|nr:hypothetical protein G4B88_030378 [Cannabis sativa]